MKNSDEYLLEGVDVDQVPDGTDAIESVVSIGIVFLLIVGNILLFIGSLFPDHRRHRA